MDPEISDFFEKNWFLRADYEHCTKIGVEHTYGESILSNHFPFNWPKALAYAQKYCGQQNNSCGVFYDENTGSRGDCAHFVAHCLAEGGLKFSNLEFKCPAGMARLARDVGAGLSSASTKFDNIKLLEGFRVTTRLDIGFFVNLFGKQHAFILAEEVLPNGSGAKIFGHTNNRCGELVQDGQFASGRYYRIS